MNLGTKYIDERVLKNNNEANSFIAANLMIHIIFTQKNYLPIHLAYYV